MKKSTDLFTTTASSIRRLSLTALITTYLIAPAWGQVKNAEITGSPRVEEDRVTLRVKVTGDQEKPVMDLSDTDFEIFVDGEAVPFRPEDWLNPEESTPPPAWIIVLLDMSGSMREQDELLKTSKLKGAIEAIRRFNTVAANRGGDTHIAIVPFGESGSGCAESYPINTETLDKFFPAGDFKLENYLQYLEGLTPCASTNLYDPVNTALRFLRDDPRFNPPEDPDLPENQQPIPPRLSLILLSDGYHTAGNEAQYKEDMENLIRANSNVIIHTLGYGLTPEQLGAKYKLGRPATRNDVKDVNGGIIDSEEFVDQKALADMANLTGGIAEFSRDSDAVADNLQLFLNALLGEYQITYNEPNPERGSKHDVYVEVISPDDGEVVASDPQSYTMTVFGRTLPLTTRLGMLGVVFLVLGGLGWLPYWFWGQTLKR